MIKFLYENAKENKKRKKQDGSAQYVAIFINQPKIAQCVWEPHTHTQCVWNLLNHLCAVCTFHLYECDTQVECLSSRHHFVSEYLFHFSVPIGFGSLNYFATIFRSTQNKWYAAHIFPAQYKYADELVILVMIQTNEQYNNEQTCSLTKPQVLFSPFRFALFYSF